MSMPLIFNELSAIKAINKHEAYQCMDAFIQLLAGLFSCKTEGHVRVNDDFWFSEIADSTTIYDWIDDRTVNRDDKDFLLGVGTKSPLYFTNDILYEELQDAEFQYKDKRATGLGVAQILDALAVSLPISNEWHNSSINLLRNILIDKGEIEQIEVTVKNISRNESIKFHEKWITERYYEVIKCGRDIWEKRQDVFQNLYFCRETEAQLTVVGSHHAWFQAVKDVLRIMNEHFDSIHDLMESQRVGEYRITDESNKTKNHPRCRELRTFTCEDGARRIFSWHVKFSSLRIHFLVTEDKIQIGHIGKHLPTSSDFN